MSLLDTSDYLPHPDITKIVKAVSKDRKDMFKYFIRRQILDASKTRNDPDVVDKREATPGSHVMFYREHGATRTREWTGTYIRLDVNESTTTALGQSGTQYFQLSFVKRYHIPETQDSVTEDTNSYT